MPWNLLYRKYLHYSIIKRIFPICAHRRTDSAGSGSPPMDRPNRPPLQPLNKSINSAFEAYERPPSPRDRAQHSPRDRLPPSPRERAASSSPKGVGPPSPRFRAPPSPRDRTPPSPRELNPPSPRMPRVPPPSPNLAHERFAGNHGSHERFGASSMQQSGGSLDRQGPVPNLTSADRFGPPTSAGSLDRGNKIGPPPRLVSQTLHPNRPPMRVGERTC